MKSVVLHELSCTFSDDPLAACKAFDLSLQMFISSVVLARRSSRHNAIRTSSCFATCSKTFAKSVTKHWTLSETSIPCCLMIVNASAVALEKLSPWQTMSPGPLSSRTAGSDNFFSLFYRTSHVYPGNALSIADNSTFMDGD